jgi:hypothetical protein
MDDLVHAAKGAAYQVCIADITFEELDFLIERFGRPLPAMDLVDQVVENAQPVSALKQSTGEMAADKAGPARDQYRPRHVLSFGSALAADEFGEAACFSICRLVLNEKSKIVLLEQSEKLVPFDLFELFIVLAEIESQDSAFSLARPHDGGATATLFSPAADFIMICDSPCLAHKSPHNAD